MAKYLMRMLRNASKWGDHIENGQWTDDDCPSDVLFQLYDTKGSKEGVSVWELDGETPEEITEEIETLVAAHQLALGRFNEVSVIYIEREKVKAAGIKIDESDGQIMLKTGKKKHRDLKSVSISKLTKLSAIVRESMGNGGIVTVTKESIEKRVLQLFHGEDLDKTSFSRKSDAVRDLVQSGYLIFAIPEKKQKKAEA